MAMRKKAAELVPATASELSTATIDLRDARDATYLRTVSSLTRSRSLRSWQWYNEIGEIHYAVSRNAKVAGYTTIGVYERNEDGTPGKLKKGGMENEILGLLTSPYGGPRGFVERFFTLMKVPGDAYLIRCREDGEVRGHDWLAADEIEKSTLGEVSLGGDREAVFKPEQEINRIILPSSESGSGNQLVIPVQARDFVGRVWRPAGRYVAVADSPMRSLDTTCELLHLLTLNIRAKLLSRFALNGIFFVPSEISTVRSGAPSGSGEGQVHDMTTLDRLIMAATWAVQNHESPEAAIPIFMSGPGQYADMIKHITYDRQIYEVDMKLRGELIDRVLMGLDSTPQGVKGNADTNHWGAWASTDEERRVNIQPDIETMCWALTRLGLWREMKDRKQTPGKIMGSMIWYDMSSANAKTNLAEDSRQVRDRLLIGDAGARRLSGIPESDAPTEAETVRMVGVKANVPYLALWGLDVHKEIDWDKVSSTTTGPDANSPAAEPQVGPGVGQPGSPNDNKSDTPRKQRPA